MAITASSRPLFFAACLAVFLCSLLGRFGSAFWLFDLFSHFTLQYLGISLLLLGMWVLWYRKAYGGLFLLSACIFLSVSSLLPFYETPNSAPNSASRAKIVSINLNRFNDNWRLLSDYLEREKPDIVAFSELTPEWGKQINNLSGEFPYGKAVLQDDNFGIGIISRTPLRNIEIRRETAFELPFIAAESDFWAGPSPSWRRTRFRRSAPSAPGFGMSIWPG